MLLFVIQPYYLSFLTSSIVGIEDDAPIRETVIDEALVAISKASLIFIPIATEAIKYPVKVSPAAVVSTTLASYMGTVKQRSLFLKRQPFLPNVKIKLLSGYFFIKFSAIFFGMIDFFRDLQKNTESAEIDGFSRVSALTRLIDFSYNFVRVSDETDSKRRIDVV